MPQPSSPSPSRPTPTNFREIARIDDEVEPELRLFLVITERVSDGKISFCTFREFERDGDAGKRLERSTYLAQRHIPGAIRLLKEAHRRLDQMEERARGERRAAAGQP